MSRYYSSNFTFALLKISSCYLESSQSILNSCPDCNKTYNEKMAECPFCGCCEKPHSAIPKKCPRCTTVYLDTPDSESEGVYSCDNCEGMWVTQQAFTTATSLKTVINSNEVSATFRKPKYKEDPGYLPCSCCGKKTADH